MADDPTIVDRFEGLLGEEGDPLPVDPTPDPDPDDPDPNEPDPNEPDPNSPDPDDPDPDDPDPDDPDPNDLSDALWIVPGIEGDLTTQEMIDGHMRHSDYTRKTQKLAEDRRNTEAAEQVARDKSSQYEESLGRLETAIESLLPKEDDTKLAELRESNPAEYAARMADIQKGKEKLAAVQAERQRLSDEKTQELQEAYGRELQKEDDLLLQKVPEWKDEAVRGEEIKGLVAVAKSLGYDDQDIAGVTDHRLILLLRMAAQQHKQQGLEPIVRRRTKGAPTVSRPGAKKRPTSKKGKSREYRERLRKTGEQRDAVPAFLDYLEAEG